jgi:hypothetical protein
MRGLKIFLSAAVVLGATPNIAGVIGPGDFGIQAHVETFDSLAPTSNSGSLLLDGITYSFTPSGYQILTADTPNYLCISGTCLGNGASGAFWLITLATPINRVGRYLSGAGDNLVVSQTDV